MLSAALRGGTPTAIGSQPCPLQPRLPPVLQQPTPTPRALASSYSSLTDEPIFESPRAQAVGMPLQSRLSVHTDGDVDVDGSSSGDELEGDVFGAGGLEDGPSASSSQSQHAHHLSLSTPNAAGPMASSVAASTAATLLSAGPSGEFTIGRAAMPTKGSRGDLQAELEHLTSFSGGRGSRPIGIPRSGGFAPSTYHPSAGAFMQGFVPPHELAAASVQESDPMVAHSHRHKSIADRLRTVVFEQTGHMSLTTAAAFLQPGPGTFQAKRP